MACTQEVSRRVLVLSHSDVEGANISAAEGEISAATANPSMCGEILH